MNKGKTKGVAKFKQTLGKLESELSNINSKLSKLNIKDIGTMEQLLKARSSLLIKIHNVNEKIRLTKSCGKPYGELIESKLPSDRND